MKTPINIFSINERTDSAVKTEHIWNFKTLDIDSTIPNEITRYCSASSTYKSCLVILFERDIEM